MENCEHDTHHDDCCVCWHKQGMNQSYPNDIPLFMHKMAALLMNKNWRTYCLEMALGAAKDKFESNWDGIPSELKRFVRGSINETESTAQKVLEMRRNAVTW
tara:strand:+ start:273 stop:578 length:306 start_codon:yes stop_codon:yes gene_type:complete